MKCTIQFFVKMYTMSSNLINVFIIFVRIHIFTNFIQCYVYSYLYSQLILIYHAE